MSVLKNGFIRSTFFSVGGFGLLMISNFLITIVLMRFMGAAEYGVFNAFFYLLLGFAQSNNSLQLAVAKYTSDESKTLRDSICDITPTLVIFGAVFFVLFAAFSPLLKTSYRLPHIRDAWIGGLVIAIWLVRAGFLGVYQGKMKFSVYGFNIGLEGIARAFAGIFLVILGYGVGGAVGASVLSGLIAIFILIEGKFNFILHHLHIRNWIINKKLAVEFLKACSVLLPFGMITALDLFLIQNLIGGKEGFYIAACSLFGKNLIILSLVFSNVVYSYMLRKRENTFWIGIGLTVVIFLITALTTVFIGNWLTALVMGGPSPEVARYLPVYILASMPLGVMQNIVNYSIAKESKTLKVAVWIILIILAISYYWILKTLPLISFLWMMLAIGTLMNLILLGIIVLQKKMKLTVK